MASDAAVVGGSSKSGEDGVGGVIDDGYGAGVGGCEEDEAEGIERGSGGNGRGWGEGGDGGCAVGGYRSWNCCGGEDEGGGLVV